MRSFLLATHNQNKVFEFRGILESLKDRLGNYELLSFDDISYLHDVDETGETFEENAALKAKAGAELGYITIADDSGLVVDALNGAPGIYSARYSGAHGDHEENNRLLLRNMSGKENRCAHYVCAIACMFPDGRQFAVRGTCDGVILEAPRGDGGFGYDPLFYIPERRKTFAEMTPEEKNEMSHRGKAARLFAEELLKYLP